jgi:hypothetical protein
MVPRDVIEIQEQPLCNSSASGCWSFTSTNKNTIRSMRPAGICSSKLFDSPRGGRPFRIGLRMRQKPVLPGQPSPHLLILRFRTVRRTLLEELCPGQISIAASHVLHFGVAGALITRLRAGAGTPFIKRERTNRQRFRSPALTSAGVLPMSSLNSAPYAR